MFKRTFVILLCLVLLATVGIPVRAQQTAGQYFPETGHNVLGDFYTFYQGIPDAAMIFGYPITEEYVNSQGLKVQYFQRVRLNAELGSVGWPNGADLDPDVLYARITGEPIVAFETAAVEESVRRA